MKTNKEGLTWLEWLRATGHEPGMKVHPDTLSQLAGAWEAGVDPTEMHISGTIQGTPTKPATPTHERVGKLVCPKCGNSDAMKIRHVESIEVYRQVQGIVDGTIQIDGLYASGEGYDDGTNPYFECHAEPTGVRGDTCLHRWPIPDWVQEAIDWT